MESSLYVKEIIILSKFLALVYQRVKSNTNKLSESRLDSTFHWITFGVKHLKARAEHLEENVYE